MTPNETTQSIKAVYKFQGMNNVDDSIEVGNPQYSDSQVVFTEAVDIVNADIDDRGGLSLRDGYTLVLAGNIHSGWSNGKEAYFVEGTSLKRFWPNNTSSIIKSGLTPNLPMYYVQVNDVIVYSNGVEQGIIENGEVFTPFVPTDPYKTAFPTCLNLEFFNGRLYGSNGNTLYFSDSLDAPGGVEGMDERYCTIPISDKRITMIKKTTNGLFISDTDEVFFLQMDDPVVSGADGMKLIPLGPYGAIPNTVQSIKAEYLGIPELSGNCILWTSKRGICVGSEGGYISCPTQGKVSLKEAKFGASMIRFKNGAVSYITVLRDTNTDYFNSYTPRTINVETTTII